MQVLRGLFKVFFGRRVNVDDIVSEDIIIVVIGPTGAGKSSGNQLLVNHGLESCTEKVQGVKCMYPGDQRRRSVVFVDTPAFNHHEKPVAEIGREIQKWMTKTYSRKNKVAGILYLHRISDSWGGSVLPRRILLATTMWGQVDYMTAIHREEAIRSVWGSMAALGSGMTRFGHTTESAWQIVDLLLGQ